MFTNIEKGNIMRRFTGFFFGIFAMFMVLSIAKMDAHASEIIEDPEQVEAEYSDEDVYYMGSSWQNQESSQTETDVTGNSALFSYESAARSSSATCRAGVDISKHQGDVNFARMKAAGVEFVIIRAGYRSESTGAVCKDPKFDTYMQGALKAGLKVGVYFYTQAISEAEAQEEALAVLGWASKYNLSLPIFTDYEWSSSSARLCAAGLSKDTATSVIRAFMSTINSYGYSAGVYSNDYRLANSFNASQLAIEGYIIWAASYGSNNGTANRTPKYYGGVYDLWQYSSKGSGSSYGASSTYIDLDYWYDGGSFSNMNYSYVFDADFYAATYPDLTSAGLTTDGELFRHYVTCGLSEGRAGSPIFCIQDYKNYNSDLVAAFGDNIASYIAHFQVSGMTEGRRSISSFSVQSYKNLYSDLRELYGNNLKNYYLHYLYYGYSEGRTAIGHENEIINATTKYQGVDYSAVYDFNYYSNKYPDLVSSFGTDDGLYIQHFVECGMNEGRQAKSSFNVFSYLLKYSDLRRAFGTDLKNYYLHYVTNGKSEGRAGTGCTTMTGATTVYNGVDYSAVYDYNYYISKYADLKKAFYYDDYTALQHFVSCGMSEGRQAKSTFEVQSYLLQYSDLRRAFGTDLKSYYLHYLANGKSEGRAGTGCATMTGATTVYNGVDYSAVYDYNYYVNKYSDLKRAFAYDDAAALAHFVNCGMSEGRQASDSFNVYTYKNNYTDLQNAYGNNLKSYYLHYVSNGKSEGRNAVTAI